MAKNGELIVNNESSEQNIDERAWVKANTKKELEAVKSEVAALD
jgi:hypothetical protein